MDCMDFMKDVPNKFYDLAIVDPPYGIDIDNMNMGVGKGKRSSKIKNRKWRPKGWDNQIPEKKYFNELFRVSKNQIIWGGNYFDLPPFKHYIVWDKGIPDGLSFSDCELAWTSFNKSQIIFKNSIYGHKKERIHPTQKPVKLYEWLLINYAKEGDKILDTHVGSQSSRIACYNLGYSLDIIELDEEYFEQGNKRFNQHKKQLTLF